MKYKVDKEKLVRLIVDMVEPDSPPFYRSLLIKKYSVYNLDELEKIYLSIKNPSQKKIIFYELYIL